jgi:hypothetical protein
VGWEGLLHIVRFNVFACGLQVVGGDFVYRKGREGRKKGKALGLLQRKA